MTQSDAGLAKRARGGRRGRGLRSAAARRSAPPTSRRYLTLAEDNPSSIRSCLAAARDNARAARTALTVEVWEAINRAWLIIRDRTKPGGVAGDA